MAFVVFCLFFMRINTSWWFEAIKKSQMIGAEQTAVLSGSELSPSPPSDCRDSCYESNNNYQVFAHNRERRKTS